MKREDLDHAIDRAVRDMMDVDPPPGLRERVRARLEVRERPLFGPLRLALTACAALALLVWMFGARPAERVPDATVAQTDATRPQETANPGTTNPGTANPGTGNPRTVNPRTANPRTVNPRTVNPRTVNPRTVNPATDRPVHAASIDVSELPEEEPIAIEELDAIAPLAVAALQPEPITAASDIRIAPLLVDHIEIAPLTSPR
jgi:hypothetical protein